MATAYRHFQNRLWGCLPLLFFAFKLWQYRAPAEIYQLFWFCNLSNLILGIAIFLRWGNLVFICSVLLMVGFPIWVFDFMVNGDFHPFSILTHTVSPALGFLCAMRLGWSRHILWQTVLYYLALQLLARLFTPATYNINVAFEIYAPVKKVFPNFMIYSLTNLAGLAVTGWLADKLLRRFQSNRLPLDSI